MSEEQPEDGRDEGGAGERPASGEERQTPADSGQPPVPEEGTPPGGEQAGEEVTEDEGGAGQPSAIDLGVDVPDDLREEIERLISRYPEKRSASIPVLHEIQRRYGWCTPEGIEQAAAVMGVEPAYLEGVATFYDLFHLEPRGEHQILVCTNISCWMRGADDLLDAFCQAASADPEHARHGGTMSEAGDIYVSGFECLGACDVAPMTSIDDRYYGPLGEDDAAAVVSQLREGADPVPDKALALRPVAGGPDAPTAELPDA